MQENRASGGSATRWGRLFGARARDWSETWEGPRGWGTPVYEHVLDQVRIGSGSRVLDCGCGAGRFARMASDRGAIVAGIDAAEGLIEIAAERTPEGDFRVGDLEALPWPEDSFDVVTGFSAFQFADDKVRALTEARRVSRGPVAVVIPSRVSESGITLVFKPLFPHFAPETLVHIQNRYRVRRYSENHETSDLRPFTFGHRKRAVANRATLQRRFRHAPSPDHPRQRQG